jgi:hypothetical protein
MKPHPWDKGLDPAKHKPAVKWRGSLSLCIAKVLMPLVRLLILRYNRSAYNIAVAIQVLCCGMHDYVGAEFKGALIHWR